MGDNKIWLKIPFSKLSESKELFDSKLLGPNPYQKYYSLVSSYKYQKLLRVSFYAKILYLDIKDIKEPTDIHLISFSSKIGTPTNYHHTLYIRKGSITKEDEKKILKLGTPYPVEINGLVHRFFKKHPEDKPIHLLGKGRSVMTVQEHQIAVDNLKNTIKVAEEAIQTAIQNNDNATKTNAEGEKKAAEEQLLEAKVALEKAKEQKDIDEMAVFLREFKEKTGQSTEQLKRQVEENTYNVDALKIIGEEFNQSVELKDFDAAADSLQNCEIYNPRNALDNATFLEYNLVGKLKKEEAKDDGNNIDTLKAMKENVEKIADYKRYLKYNIETKTKKRLKNGKCRTMGKWKFDLDNETKDVVGESLFYKEIKELLEEKRLSYHKDSLFKDGEVAFITIANRAIKEIEIKATTGKEESQWVAKDKKVIGKRNITSRMMDRFIREASGKKIIIPGTTNLITVRSEKDLTEEAKDFIRENGDKDDFEDIILNSIQK